MTGSDGLVVRFVRSEIDFGEGVYRIESVDGAAVDNAISLSPRSGMFRGYVGCFVTGRFSRSGQSVGFGQPTAIGAVTTTVPESQTAGLVQSGPPPDPAFSCANVTDTEAEVLRILEAGKGMID